jgi:hypothetical protein
MRCAQCRAAVVDILGLRASRKKGTGTIGPVPALALALGNNWGRRGLALAAVPSVLRTASD